MKFNRTCVFAVLSFAALILIGSGYSAAQQIERQAIAVPLVIDPQDEEVQDAKAKQDEEKKKDDEKKDEEKKKEGEKEEQLPMIETDSTASEKPGEREIRLQLWDGSIVTGDFGLDAIHIDTKFGTLEVPVAHIVYLRSGLNNMPEMNQRIDELVKQLGDKEFQIRENAHRQLQAMGLLIRNHLKTFSDAGSPERKNHLQAISDELDQMTEESADQNSDGNNVSLDLEDSITTNEFTIVGKIKETKFSVTTKYGLLDVELKDIKRGDRNWNVGGTALRKTLEIKSTAFFQREPVSTRIRIKPGDQIAIRASGNINWASWGNINSSPDGIPSQGQWNGINCGTLVARIGKSGEVVKIGSKGQFVAKTTGELFLGIAMQDNIASQDGYQWNGTYSAKVTVEPEKK